MLSNINIIIIIQPAT